ncbi:hypothetical protein [Trinickia mobilis]|uniref:hypothetical protein n=1 Tax=Trinickia mobilis TaxID=2816356 RepID=UPI001A8D8BF5|nr:hypothetical protein [Trinickia mobilis]
MSKVIKFYFDVASPTSYLAHLELPNVAKETNAQIHRVPVLLGAFFPAIGNEAPTRLPATEKWIREEI